MATLNQIPPPGSEEEGPLKSRDELEREIKALREQISKPSAASLRATASLDVSTVLREIAGGARELTSAKYRVMTTLDDLD